MNQYNSYYLYQQFEKRGSQDWLPCYPNIFSVDGDGTMPLVMNKENDPDCGYTGDTEPIYRWYPLPITTDYICDECPVVQYRWENMNPSTDYYCDGTTKYYKQIRQYSYDSGMTWYDVTPPEYQQGSVYEQQSTDCGYVPPLEPIYRWTKTDDVTCVWIENQYRTTTGTPYCEGYDKYVEVYSQVSYDGGITWSTTATTPTLVEAWSQDCGYVPLQRTTTGTPYCTGYDKYVDVYSEISYDNGTTWETASTTPTLVEAYSQDCGYVPLQRTTSGTPYCTGYDKYVDVYSQVSYDGGTTWETTATTTTLVETYSEDCGYIPLHRTTTGTPYCTGYDKYVDVYNEVSYDGGTTWETAATTTALVEAYSEDCGYVPIPSDAKVRLSYENGDVYTAACDSNTTLTTGDTKPTGYTYSAMTLAEIGSCVTSIGDMAFSSCSGLTGIVVSSGVTSIGGASFSQCYHLTRVVIPDSVTSIGMMAFMYCSGMTSCTIGSGVTSIGRMAFYDCFSLTGITIPDSVTSIGNDAFTYCTGLTSCTIGSGVTSIDEGAFSNCSGLESVTINAVTPPTLGSYVFSGTNCPIYVPAGSVNAYKAASGWSNYSSRIQAITQV